MSDSLKETLFLIGASRVPKGDDVPAAWWITTHDSQLKAYDQWKIDYKEHIDKTKVLADTLGVGIDAGRTFVNFFAPVTTLSGFEPPRGMTLWENSPDYIPVPAGWRLNKRENRLVPLRKTKTDRESQANKDFDALRKIPDVRAYLQGMPINFRLPKGNGATGIYSVGFWRGERCVMALSDVDPDRCEDRSDPIDTGIWKRQPLPLLIELRKAAA